MGKRSKYAIKSDQLYTCSMASEPPPPHPNSRIVYNVDANILFKVCDVWFWEAARYSEDDKIQINNALI